MLLLKFQCFATGAMGIVQSVGWGVVPPHLTALDLNKTGFEPLFFILSLFV